MLKIKSANQKLKIIIPVIIGCVIILAGALFGWRTRKSKMAEAENNYIVVDELSGIPNDKKQEPLLPMSSISGIRSENGNRRPFAVMLAGDEEVRPLSGIGQADLVVEMPVIENGINRMMAVYVSEDPKDIGSARSARHDFIPLAKGLGAIFVHWGGSHFALDKLNKKVIDNLDALINPHDVFYRKNGIAMPNNGFTTMDRMINASEKLGYEMTINGDVNTEDIIEDAENWNPEIGGWEYSGKDIKINYPGKFGVEWKFNSINKMYYRFRGGTSEIDKNTGRQVTATVVAVLEANSRHLEEQYNDVDIEGSNALTVYQQGYSLSGKWSKDIKDQSSPMLFLDSAGNKIQLLAGQRWWEIIADKN